MHVSNSILIIIQLVDVFQINGEIRVFPKRLIKSEGDEAVLNCYYNSSTPNNRIMWSHIPVGARVDKSSILYTGWHMNKAYKTRHNNSCSEPHFCVLKIAELSLSDAGIYRCAYVETRNEFGDIQLTVIESPPRCSSNISVNDVLIDNECGLSPDFMGLTCSLIYHGNFPPVLEWRNSTRPENIISRSKSQPQANGNASVNLSLKPEIHLNGTYYICSVKDIDMNISKSVCNITDIKVAYIFKPEHSTEHSNESDDIVTIKCVPNTSSRQCDFRWHGNISPSNASFNASGQNLQLNLQLNKFINSLRCEYECEIPIDRRCSVTSEIVSDISYRAYNSESLGCGNTDIINILFSIILTVSLAVFVIVIVACCSTSAIQRDVKKIMGYFEKNTPKMFNDGQGDQNGRAVGSENVVGSRNDSNMSAENHPHREPDVDLPSSSSPNDHSTVANAENNCSESSTLLVEPANRIEQPNPGPRAGPRPGQLIIAIVYWITIIIHFGNLHLIGAEIRTYPTDLIRIEGDSALLHCESSSSSSNPPSLLRWRHWRFEGSTDADDVIFDEKFMDQFDKARHSVTVNESPQTSDLNIKGITVDDAGTYICANVHNSTEYSNIELTVLVSQPNCGSNISLTNVLVENECNLSPDYTDLSCSVGYRGQIAPILEWIHSEKPEIVIASSISQPQSNGIIRVNHPIKPTYDMNGTHFICSLEGVDLGIQERKCSTRDITIDYIFRPIATTISRNVVICIANTSSQQCDYKWHGSGVEFSGQRLQIDKTIYNLHCATECEMHGQTCNVTSQGFTQVLSQDKNMLTVILTWLLTVCSIVFSWEFILPRRILKKYISVSFLLQCFELFQRHRNMHIYKKETTELEKPLFYSEYSLDFKIEKLRKKLNDNRTKYEKKLEVSTSLLATLLSKGVIEEERKTEGNAQEKVDSLIDIFGRRLDAMFELFNDVLQYKYSEFYDRLNESGEDMASSIRTTVAPKKQLSIDNEEDIASNIRTTVTPKKQLSIDNEDKNLVQKHQSVLKMNRSKLLFSIHLDFAFWSCLRKYKVLDRDREEMIKKTGITEGDQVGLILDLILRKEGQEFEEAFLAIIRALVVSNQSYIAKFLDEDLANNSDVIVEKEAFSLSTEGVQLMRKPDLNDELKIKMRRCFTEIVRSIDPKGYVADKLFEKGIIPMRSIVEMNNAENAEARASILLSHLFQTSHPRAFVDLREALRIDYGWIVKMIDGSTENWKEKLHVHHERLVQELDVSVIFLASLLAEDVISNEHKAVIQSKRTSHEKVDSLIDILQRKNNRCYEVFCGILRHHNKDLADLLTDHSSWTTTPNERYRNNMKNFYLKIRGRLDPRGHILSTLFETGVLTDGELRRLNSVADRGSQIDQLYMILSDKPANTEAFVYFQKALQKDYRWMAGLLDKED